MEDWIDRNSIKIILVITFFALFGCFNVIQRNRVEIPRIERLENQIDRLENQVDRLENQAQNHIHRYYNGKPNQQRRMK